MSLTALGTGIGLVVFPPLIVVLFEKYGYMGNMLILGGVSLHSILAGLLLRPLPRENQMPAIGQDKEIPAKVRLVKNYWSLW